MAITINLFDNVSALSKYVDQTIADTRASLGAHMRQVDEIRRRYEKVKKQYEGLKKLSGGKNDSLRDTKQLDIAGFKVLVNPTAEYELTLMNEAISSLQDQLKEYEKTKELFPSVSDENMKIGMVLNDGVPTGFIFYTHE